MIVRRRPRPFFHRANRVQPGGDDGGGAHGGGRGGGEVEGGAPRSVAPSSCEAESIGKPQLKTRFIGLLASNDGGSEECSAEKGVVNLNIGEILLSDT